ARLHRTVVDDLAGDAEAEQLRHSGATHLDRDGAARRTAQQLEGLVLVETNTRLAVNGDDLVTRLDAGALGRGLRQRSDDEDQAVANVDLDAESTVVAGGLLIELAVVLALEERRVRIAEL